MADGISFSADIRPLFTSEDIRAMRRMGLDLADLALVRKNSQRILARLADKSMPPDRPWPEEQIERFRAWVEGGMEA